MTPGSASKTQSGQLPRSAVPGSHRCTTTRPLSGRGTVLRGLRSLARGRPIHLHQQQLQTPPPSSEVRSRVQPYVPWGLVKNHLLPFYL